MSKEADANQMTQPLQGKMIDCQRKPDGPGYWICHRCGSLWSDMLAGTGWHPLSCPKQKMPGYDPQPGSIDAALAEKS